MRYLFLPLVAAWQEEPRARTVADLKDLVRSLEDFSSEELRKIPVVPTGAQLKQGAIYLDLANSALGPFAASHGIVAREHNYFVPKEEIPYEYWNRLLAALGRAE